MLVVGVLFGMGSAALGQRGSRDGILNPVYFADAPVAIETLERAEDLMNQGSSTEAARSLTELIIEHGDRFVPQASESNRGGKNTDKQETDVVWVSVRVRIEDAILENAELLEAYQRVNSAKAQRIFDSGDWPQVEQEYWLTGAGCDAGLNRAQVLIESGRFGAGARALERLLVHPDAAGRSGRGFELAGLVYRVRRDAAAGSGVGSVARRWAELAGDSAGWDRLLELPRFEGAVDMEVQVSGLRSSPIKDRDSGLRLDGIVSEPIAVGPLTPWEAVVGLVVGLGEEGGVDDTGISGTATKPRPWAMPVVMGDALLTNDGVTISCFDRFTLRPRWRLKTTDIEIEEQDRTSAGVRARIARTIEDLSSVTVVDGVVYAAAGLARTGGGTSGRTGDDRLLGIDLKSGRILRSTTLEELDPSLKGSVIRGTVIVDGDTIVVSARKSLRRERLVAMSLVGIDRRSFELLWTRQIASAGVLPFQQSGQISHSGVLEDGVVYWTDLMGIVCAVESVSGRVLWARALPGSDVYGRYELDPWTVSTPIVRGDDVYVLRVDGREILQLDKATGRLKESAVAMVSGRGLYLVETLDQIACVNLTEITVHSFDRFGVVRPRPINLSGSGRELLRGRVIGAGSELIVPIERGLVVLDTQRISGGGAVNLSFIELEQSGLSVVLDGQVIVAGENKVSSYLSWDIARRLLIDRIELAGDIHAAVTMSELALRSGHQNEILPVIDRAMEMLRDAAGSVVEGDGQRDEVQSRLFLVMLQMVGLPGVAGEGSHRVGPEIRSGLLERAEKIASTREQSLAHQMTLGAWMTALGQPNKAVGVYHGVLMDESLASGMWRGGGVAIRAEIEASNQLDEIVSRYGRKACAVFDELALGDLEALGDSGEAIEYEKLARRYPWALSTPGVWAMAAERWERSGNAAAAVWAAKSGLESAEKLGAFGSPPDQALIDLLGSVYIGGLIGSQREGEAAREAGRLVEKYRMISLRIDGELVNPDGLWAGLSEKLLGPVLGDRFVQSDTPVLVAGSPVRSPMRSGFDSMVFFAPQLKQARMVRFDNGRPGVVWVRESPGIEAPMVVVENGLQTVLQWSAVAGDARGGSIESIETNTGDSRWKIMGVGRELLDGSDRNPDEIAGIDRQFNSPVEGMVPIDQIVMGSDGSMMVVSDRVGRAMGIDLMTGRVVWKMNLPMNRVYDMDLHAGVLGVVGMWYENTDVENGIAEGRHTRVAAIDAQSGRLIQLLDGQTAVPRWIRVAPSGNLIVGTSLRVMSVSTRTGSFDWVLHTPELFRSNAGWIVDQTLVVLDEFVNLWTVGMDDGKLNRSSLDTKGRIAERGWLEVRKSGDGMVFGASGGMGVIDADGRTVGIDSHQMSRTYVGAGWGSDRVALVKRAGRGDESKTEIPLMLFDLKSAMLMDSVNLMLPSAIERQPIAIQASNGVIAVGFGEVSVIVQTQ